MQTTNFEDQSETTMSLFQFMQSRGIDENTICHFQDEKIDETTLLIMSEDDLQKHIPKYGDRVAVLHYCNKKKNSARKSLFEKLQLKLSAKSTVKTKSGGGTRKLQVPTSTCGKDILNRAREIFFPQEVSPLGKLEQFTFEVLDYKCHKFDNNMTVAELYEITQLTSLRFYLASYRNEDEPEDQEDDIYVPTTAVSSKQSSTDCVFLSNTEDTAEDNTVQLETDSSDRFGEQLAFHLSTNFEDPGISATSLLLPSNLDNFDSADAHYYVVPDMSPLPDEEYTRRVEKIILHRGNVFKELIDIFKMRSVTLSRAEIEMILPNGQSELAEDMGGVLRDTISEFFSTFYETCTMGATLKVPSLRHDFQESEWKAVGNIISESFSSEGYFPIKLSPVFIKFCIDEPFEDHEVLTDFLKYVSTSESALITQALESFDDTDFDDLMEFCSTYVAKTRPTNNNIRTMILQIAKEELLQKPAYVKDCFSPYLKILKYRLNLEDIYSALEPTDKNIIPLLETECMSMEQSKIFGYLKKYIKESDTKTKERFLRFVTGSDVGNQKIKIEFINSEGICRAPIAHTCSKLLQIPLSYENFMTFRTEFNHLLESNIWIMDIV